MAQLPSPGNADTDTRSLLRLAHCPWGQARGVVRFGFCPLESDLKRLAAGGKLRLGQAEALASRTDQVVCLCLQHISCDAGGDSPVRHECKTIPGSAQVQPRRQAGSVPGDRQQTSVLAFTLTGAGKRLFPSYEGGNSNTQRGYHWISLGGGKARSTSACEACAALRHLCRSPQTFTTLLLRRGQT